MNTAPSLSQTAARLMLGFVLVGSSGCDDAPPPKNPFDPSPSATVKPPPVTEAPKPEGPPQIEVDSLSPKVGFTRVLLDKPNGKDKLAEEITANKSHFSGKDVKIKADRKAKPSWVVAVVQQLGQAGAETITIETETRKEYPQSVTFTPQSLVTSPAACSVVAMVREDRGTAVWKLSGGMAFKRTRGFAGPDLTMTGETIERLAKGCKSSESIFLAADEVIEWGLLYDLAASTQRLEDARFDKVVLLRDVPTAGREVRL